MAYTDIQMRAFTQIAYMDLDRRYQDYCTNNNVSSVPLNELLTEDQKQQLIDLDIKEEEIATWKISGIHNTNDTNGFYACIIETSENGEAAVGFRGSEDMLVTSNMVNDWVKADLGLVNSTCTNQQAEVECFLAEYSSVLSKYNNLAMTGHSLGGNLAEYATVVSYKYGLDKNIKQCMSLDGPGFSNEFISEYREQIDKMSGVMNHPRWSFVGTMLSDLPGVSYRYVEVSNKENKEEYNSLTRHDTVYLDHDDNGNFIPGEQDRLSCITSLMSKGLDRMPQSKGNTFITVLGSLMITTVWLKNKLFDENMQPTLIGNVTIVSAIAAIVLNPGLIGPIITTALTVVAAIASVLIVSIVTELVYELVVKVADAICDGIKSVVNWAKEKYEEFKNSVISLIDSVKDWFNSTFNSGYSYSSSHPVFTVDTYKMRDYADRLAKVNRRLVGIDDKMDSLYLKVGWSGLKHLIAADMLTGYSWRLDRAAAYLRDTASDFDSVENELKNTQ